MAMKIKYVSEWDGGSSVIMTPAQYDPEKNIVFDVEQVDIDGVNVLDREYVIINGEEREIEDQDNGTYTVIK
jgi:hypothetical protein